MSDKVNRPTPSNNLQQVIVLENELLRRENLKMWERRVIEEGTVGVIWRDGKYIVQQAGKIMPKSFLDQIAGKTYTFTIVDMRPGRILPICSYNEITLADGLPCSYELDAGFRIIEPARIAKDNVQPFQQLFRYWHKQVITALGEFRWNSEEIANVSNWRLVEDKLLQLKNVVDLTQDVPQLVGVVFNSFSIRLRPDSRASTRFDEVAWQRLDYKTKLEQKHNEFGFKSVSREMQHRYEIDGLNLDLEKDPKLHDRDIRRIDMGNARKRLSASGQNEIFLDRASAEAQALRYKDQVELRKLEDENRIKLDATERTIELEALRSKQHLLGDQIIREREARLERQLEEINRDKPLPPTKEPQRLPTGNAKNSSDNSADRLSLIRQKVEELRKSNYGTVDEPATQPNGIVEVKMDLKVNARQRTVYFIFPSSYPAQAVNIRSVVNGATVQKQVGSNLVEVAKRAITDPGFWKPDVVDE